MRKFITLIITVLIIVSLTSCYDAREIDELTYVIAIGIDKGVSQPWRLTVQFPALKGSGGSEGGGGGDSSSSGSGDYTVMTVEAPTFFTGLNMINTSVPRELNFMHTNYLVVSEELARSGELGVYIAPIVRYRQVRRILNVVVSRSTAADFIKENKPTVGVSMPKTMQLMVNESHNTGLLVHITLNDFYNGLKSTYRQPYAGLVGVNNLESLDKAFAQKDEKSFSGGVYKAGEVPRVGGIKAEFFGSALFDDSKMVAELNGDETRIMQMINGEYERGFFTLPDPKSPNLKIPLDVRMSRNPKIKVRFEGGKPIIDVTIKLEGDLLSVQSRINYESEELKPVLEHTFEEYIKKGMEELVNKCKDLKVDVFNFGRAAVRHFGTIEEWEQYGWNRQFKNAQVNVNVLFNIRRTGGMLKSAPLVSSEGKE